MDKVSKKRYKKAATWIAMALVVALLTAMPLMAKAEAEAEGPVASTLSGTVERGDLDMFLRGGGTLTTKDAQDVKLPEQVKITEFLVKNGDLVAEGDPVAAVDRVSVMSAILEVDETLKLLQEKLEEAKGEQVDAAIKATAGGRVKAIYAQPGDSVQEVMLQHGALAVLSLDGLMAVKLPQSGNITTGDSVQVTLSDNSVVTGRVESSLDGVLVITVEDEGYAIGETVSVSDSSGQLLGLGSLYVHNAWKATAFTGTISQVNVPLERTLYDGAILFQLKDREFMAELEYLANQHREYEQLLQRLFQMYETGFVTAPCDGMVSGVDKDSAFLLAGEAEDWQAQLLEAPQEDGWTVMLLSAEPSAPDAPQNPDDTPDTTTYIGYAGKVTAAPENGTEIVVTMSQVGGTVTKTAEGGWDLSQVDLNPANMLISGMTFAVGENHGFAEGDIVVVVYDQDGNYTVVLAQPAAPDPSEPGIPGIPGGVGGGGFDFGSIMAGLGGFGGMSGAGQEEEEPLFDLEGKTLLVVVPQNTVSLTMTLDEQDIAKVHLGQGAQVKVEALGGQVFDALVTEIAISGTNNGGSSKFSVTLELDKTAQMLDGMSASAQLLLYTKADIVLIPVKALAQVGAKTVVYRAQDPETGLPADPVEVTLGISNGEFAQVLEGLTGGDTYYYTYYDTLELDTSAEEARFSF